MCLSPLTDWCLALFQDSSISLYKSPSWALVQTYPPTKYLDLRKLLWNDSCTFVGSGLGGLLSLWSTTSLEPITSCRVPGGGIWDMCQSQDQDESVYALGCDDGILRIYQFDETFFLLSTFPKQDSKILSTCISKGFYYAGTSSGAIVKFTARGQTVTRMCSDTSIWALLPTEQGIFSGEGNGSLCFWDTTKGILQQKLKTHEGDILCLCEKEGEIYASGVDSKVVRCSANGNEWIITGKARGQSHDVRTLAVIHGIIISGGITSDICLYPEEVFESSGVYSVQRKSQKLNFKRMPIRHIATLPSNTPVKRAKTYILHNRSSCLELWGIDTEAQCVTKIATVGPGGNSGISCCGISHNARYIALSTILKFRLLSFNCDTCEVEYIETQIDPCSVMAFTGTGDGLYTAYTSLFTVNLKTYCATVIHSFDSFATKICCEGAACAVLLRNNQINVYKSHRFLFTLPAFEMVVTALNFGPHKSIYLFTEDNYMHGYSIKTQSPEMFTSKYSSRFPRNFSNEANRIVGISKYGKHSIIVNTHYSFTVIDLQKKPPKVCEILTKNRYPEHKHTWAGIIAAHSLHSEKRNNAPTPENNLENFVINKRFGPILDMSVCNEQWMVCEIDWEYILSVKPKPLDIHKYGT